MSDERDGRTVDDTSGAGRLGRSFDWPACWAGRRLSAQEHQDPPRESKGPIDAILDAMACVHTSPTPNPGNAMKFTLDINLPARILANRGDDVEDVFTAAVLAIPGVEFGVRRE